MPDRLTVPPVKQAPLRNPIAAGDTEVADGAIYGMYGTDILKWRGLQPYWVLSVLPTIYLFSQTNHGQVELVRTFRVYTKKKQ